MSAIENANEITYPYASVVQKGSLSVTATSLLSSCFYRYYHKED